MCVENLIANNLLSISGKRDCRLVTHQSGNSSSQLDYVLVRKSNRKIVKDVKVVAVE